MNYIKKHWKGDLPLSISFWVNLFLLNLVIAAIFYILDKSANSFYPPNIARIFLIANIITIALIYPWQIIGTWRSSTNYVENYGSRFLSIVVKILIIFGLISSVFRISNNYPIYQANYELGFKKDSYATYNLQLNDDKTVLHVGGGIGFGISKEFKNILNKNETISVVVLDSEGGRIYEGRKLFKLIKDNELDTHTNVGCFSACAIAYMGGIERTISNNANIAFHQYSAYTDAVADKITIKNEQNKDKELFSSQGISEEFLDRLFLTESHELWFPTRDELIAANVVHVIKPTSSILPVNYIDKNELSFDSIDSLLQELSSYRAIKKYEPDIYEEIVNQIQIALHKGATQTELEDTINAFLESIFMQYLPKTSDAALLGFSKLLIKGLEKLVEADPIQCIKYLFPDQYGTSNTTVLGEEYELETIEIINQVIADSYTKEIPKIDDESASASMSKLITLMGEEIVYLDPVNLQNNNDYRKTCNAYIHYYEHILNEDSHISANVLRFNFNLN